jgi:putative DNA primase/helicase
MKIRAIDAIRGVEEEVLTQLTSITIPQMNGKNQPCPACSSSAKSDRFRVVKEMGSITGYYCGRGYGDNRKGNVIGLISHLLGITYNEAEDKVLDNRGIKSMTQEEQKEYDKKAIESRKKHEIRLAEYKKEVEHKYNEIAVYAQKIWDKSSGHLSSPYLNEKQILGLCMRELSGLLKVPVTNMDGKIMGLQSIYPNSDKQFIKGQKKSGCFCKIGAINPKKPIAFVEGYATGESVHRATELTTIVCFDAGNISNVLKLFKEKYPNTELILFADNDHGKFLEMKELAKTRPEIRPINRGNETIAEASLLGILGVQPLLNGDHDKISDWNDIYCHYGISTLLKQTRLQYKK